ncbi:unnamed protein product [Colias eurytheme]|nr:unnamed protein product [Colias eurytheme]
MYKILWYCLCTCVVLVKSQNQYQLVSTCPYSAQSYGNIYGSQPYITQTSPYSQQYTVQNPVANYQPTPIANQLQEIYFNRLLSNPAIQAFIDPSTKIYNQNGIEISDQIRPKGTPNVVNNYFIVPTDYVKNNESFQKDVRRNKNKISSDGSVTKVPANIYEPIQRNPNNKNKDTSSPNTKQKSTKPKEVKVRVSNNRSNKNKKGTENLEYKESTPQKSEKTRKNWNDKDMILNDDDVVHLQRNNIKRQDDPIRTQVEGNENISKKYIRNQDREESVCKVNKNEQNVKQEIQVNAEVQLQRSPLKKDKVEEIKRNNNLPQNAFDISKDGVELDNRNIRKSTHNVHNSQPKKKYSKTQDNFMKQWMSYINSFAPNQHFDSFDFSTANLPYNFEQMFQMPQFSQSSVDTNSQTHTTKKRKKKPKRKNKKTEDTKNCNDKTKITTVELVPKFIQFESDGPATEHIRGELKAKPNIETFTHSLEATHYLPDVSTEETLPIMYDIIDYYPDFTKDKIYASDEEDLYLFHNRHFYNMDDEKELNRERRRYEKTHDDNTIKHPDNRVRVNDIHSSDKDSKKAHIKPVFEDIKFQTPPALLEPGFETKRVNIREDNNNYHTYYNHENNKPTQKPIENQRKDVETVYARSKVVKYGQQGEVEAKVKVVSENDFKHDGGHRQLARDSDATVVFARSWT